MIHSSGSIERTIVRRVTQTLLTSLVLIGLGTSTVLAYTAHQGLDQTLKATAHAQAHPEARPFQVEHSHSSVRTWIVKRDDAEVPAEKLQKALDSERPVYLTHNQQRMILLPAETILNGRESHVVVAAAAPEINLLGTLTPFLLGYSGFSVLVALTASQAISRFVRAAFQPLDRAQHEVESVLALGQGARLTEAAPTEIRNLLTAFNALLDRLDRAWSIQSRFTSEAAHELRTPVAAMMGELDVALRRERDAASYRTTLVSAREEVGRLKRIIEALSALARLDTGEAEQQRQLTHASELARAALAAERAGIEARGGTVSLSLETDTELIANVPLIELALQNLLRNAGRHAPGCKVEFLLKSSDTEAIFEIHDAGAGVPEAERELVFTRFLRGSQARVHDTEGLGLGLAFAREVARRHGGDCTLTTSPLGGALLRFKIAPRRP